MANFLEHLLRAGEKREVRRANALIGQINALEFVYEEMTDEELAAQTPEFKERIKSGESLDVLIPEAFAVVREVARRVLGKRHYDVQLEGGIALHYGQVAEMKTGEGKAVTVSTLFLPLRALSLQGIFVLVILFMLVMVTLLLLLVFSRRVSRMFTL